MRANKKQEIRKVGSIGSLIGFGGWNQQSQLQTENILGSGQISRESADWSAYQQDSESNSGFIKSWRGIGNWDESDEEFNSDSEHKMFATPFFNSKNIYSDNESEGDLFDSLFQLNERLNSNTAELI